MAVNGTSDSPDLGEARICPSNEQKAAGWSFGTGWGPPAWGMRGQAWR
ncbi:MAG: hypothetical protein NZ959_05385 [Armatimonadetes bacterium]|nr:hypothetical protein [Armatimonadota bacterium]MDW8123103.1 hypothetical protein [Armatimonadota bacterium]